MSQVTPSLEVIVGGGPASSQSLNKGEELVTHVHVDEAAQGRSSIDTKVVATIQAPEIKMKGRCFCFLDPDGSRMIREETPSIPLWPGSKP